MLLPHNLFDVCVLQSFISEVGGIDMKPVAQCEGGGSLILGIWKSSSFLLVVT